MHTFKNTRLTRSLATGLLSLAGVVATAIPSSALDNEGEPGDGPPAGVYSELYTTSAKVTPFSSTEWQVDVTVYNGGNYGTGAFTNTFRADGVTTVATRPMSGIPYHQSRTDSFRIPRTGCYVAPKLSVDSGNVVAERVETNNTTWLVGQATNPCSSAPKYTIKAESFTAVDESSFNVGSDEPFWNVSSVGTTGTARTTQTKVFGGVDTGETHSSGSTEGCLWRSCGVGDYAPNGVGLSVQLWEKDQGDMTENRAKAAQYFGYAGAIASVAGAPPWVTKAIPPAHPTPLRDHHGGRGEGSCARGDSGVGDDPDAGVVSIADTSFRGGLRWDCDSATPRLTSRPPRPTGRSASTSGSVTRGPCCSPTRRTSPRSAPRSWGGWRS